MERVRILKFGIILIFLALGLGFFNLNAVQGKKFRNLSKKNCIRVLPQSGSRGRILDSDGNVLVDNYISYDALVFPQDSISPESLLNKTAQILGTGFKDLKETFRKGYIAPFMPVALAKNIEIKDAIALEELKQDLPGLVVQPRPLRDYPHGRLASHVIGYLSEIDRWRLTKLSDYGYKTKDIVGFGGVEEKLDYYLRQEEGALSVEVDHRGRLMRTLGFRPPQSGKDVQLDLSLKLQKISEASLKERKGCVIIMEPFTGRIKALVSFPDFNPSVFIKRANPEIIEGLFNSSSAVLMNRAISGAYPPASVFKLIVATAALETGKINLSTTFVCNGSTMVGKRRFSCWDVHGPMNLNAAIIHSCDVFFYKTGLLTGPQAIHDYALKFGFGRQAGIDLPYETRGFIPSPLWRKAVRFQNWYDGDTANFSIGQGETLVTPLQMARMMAAFANGGILVTPQVINSIAGKKMAGAQDKPIRLPLKESTINYVRQGLKGVVADPGGTASILSALPVSVAGKTGTAQVGRGSSHGWFAGFFPFKNPRFVICVFLEHGVSGHSAAIVAKQIIEEMFKEGLV